jgi:hypothetical protein
MTTPHDPADAVFDRAARDAIYDDACRFWPGLLALEMDLLSYDPSVGSIEEHCAIALLNFKRCPEGATISSAEREQLVAAVLDIQAAIEAFRSAWAVVGCR